MSRCAHEKISKTESKVCVVDNLDHRNGQLLEGIGLI